MSEVLFLDTSGWLAAASHRESRYAEASREFDDQLSRGATFVTSNLVLAERHALTVRSQGTRAGLALIDAIYSDPVYRVIAVDRDLESRAVDQWLRRYPQIAFSLTDAVSFQIMKDERIAKAFALDHHFEVAGFSLVPSAQRKASAKKRR